MSSAGITSTCATILNKRTNKEEAFNLRISDRQRDVLAKDATFQRRIAEAFGHAVCTKLGWNRGECQVKMMAPYGETHEKYLGVLAKLDPAAVTQLTIDVTPIIP